MPTVDAIGWIVFWWIGIAPAYGAIVHYELGCFQNAKVTWVDDAGYMACSLMSWGAVLLMFSCCINENRYFDYQFSIPSERIWSGEKK